MLEEGVSVIKGHGQDEAEHFDHTRSKFVGYNLLMHRVSKLREKMNTNEYVCKRQKVLMIDKVEMLLKEACKRSYNISAVSLNNLSLRHQEIISEHLQMGH